MKRYLLKHLKYFLVLGFFLLSYCSFSQLYYRSVANGNWNVAATWQSAPAAGGPWGAAAGTPTSADNTITIQSPNTVTINASVSIDEVTVDAGAFLVFTGATAVTIAAGAGVDLTINGTLTESSTLAMVWAGGATWQMGANGSLIKTSGTSSNNWQSSYQSGIANIPATANWILRKTGAANPPITTTNGYYPNFTIENNSGSLWTTNIGSIFTGGNYPTIKGNFDLGGTGANGIDFLDQHTAANRSMVIGNMTIRAGSNLRNFGTGFEIQGNLTVSGTTTYDANDARKFVFSGANAQTISGAGAFAIYDMQVNKTANDVTLNRTITIDHNLDLLNGKINSTMANLVIIIDDATVTSTSNASFVRGPVRKLGDEAFAFPVGKNNDYQAIGNSAGPPIGGSVTFWTENFATGAGWSLANVLGAEGSDPNFFQVTANEGGVLPPGCGVANNGNKTLHVTSVFFPGGGAAYDAGGLCGFLYCPQTNRRAESPSINCTGYSNITLAFNYIGNGQGLVDNASLWYYNGATWSMIAASLKSTTCGSGQGRWTAYSILLPASANNNPAIKIGFKWENNDDGVGTDPSFAVDDISLSIAGGVTESFTAEYFYSNPQVPYGNVLLPNLATISNCEYWILTRDIGTSNRFVTLNFDANSCGYQNTPPNLLVANYNTGQWYDRGNGGFTASSVTTLAVQTVYGPFTLGSIVPLPVELISFDAKYNGKTVDLEWITASEKNNDYFTVERTKDGKDFLTITKVPGAGNSSTTHYYTANDDAPQNGISYYRLMQTDFNGSNSYSKLVPVRINENDFGINYLYADQNGAEIYFVIKSLAGNITVDVVDVLGRIVISQKLFSTAQNEVLKINSSLLKSGIYTLRVFNNECVVNKKFFY
jgi:hypothetical protein